MELEYVISKKLQLKMKAEVCYKEKALISKLLFLFITIIFILSYKNDHWMKLFIELPTKG